MNVLLPLGILLVVGSGTGAGFVAYHYWDVASPPMDACQNAPDTSLRGGSGLLRFDITNKGPGEWVVVCAMTNQHDKVAEKEVFVPAGAHMTVDLEVPAGVYFQRLELRVDGPLHASATTKSYLLLCQHLAASTNVVLHEGGMGGSGGYECMDPGTGAKQRDYLEMVVDLVRVAPPEVRAAEVGTGTSLTTALLLIFRVPIHFGSLVLFTRLRRHELLDQGQRSTIHDLVEAEPGIHAHAISRRLSLSRGATLYHLHVLVRERVLSQVENWGRTSFFVAGRFPPKEMRARAALRSEALSRVYTAICRKDGQSLREVALASGFSLGRTSRLARRLEEAGLVKRVEAGRNVMLSPQVLGFAPMAAAA